MISSSAVMRRFSSRGGVPFLEKWGGSLASSQDGDYEQMFGAK